MREVQTLGACTLTAPGHAEPLASARYPQLRFSFERLPRSRTLAARFVLAPRDAPSGVRTAGSQLQHFDEHVIDMQIMGEVCFAPKAHAPPIMSF